MPAKAEIDDLLEQTERYLTGTLLPFWIDHAPDREVRRVPVLF